MANTKAQYVREIVIDECLSGKRQYTMAEIMEKCNKNLESQGFLAVTSKQTILDDMLRIENQWGVEIDIEPAPSDKRKKVYHYKDREFRIYKTILAGDDLLHIEQLISLLENFKGLPPMGWLSPIKKKLSKYMSLYENVRPIIELEGADLPEWSRYLSIIADAINEYSIVKIEYKPFCAKNNLFYDFKPCYLRQYNGRWFLYGFCIDKDSITTIALDRIRSIVTTEEKFQPIDFNPSSFFHDIVGATVHQETGTEIKTVMIQVLSKKQLEYIKTKPIHQSQKIESENENGGIISMQLILNYELEKIIMSFGENIRVLEPVDFANKIMERHKNCVLNYTDKF